MKCDLICDNKNNDLLDEFIYEYEKKYHGNLLIK